MLLEVHEVFIRVARWLHQGDGPSLPPPHPLPCSEHGGRRGAGGAMATCRWCLGRAWPHWLGAGLVPRCPLALGADAVGGPDRGSDSCSHSRPPAVPLMKTPALDEFGRPAHVHCSPQCVCVCVCVCAGSCPTLCNPMGCSPPGSSLHAISQQEHWSGLPCPSPGDLPDPGIEPRCPTSPALQENGLPPSHLRSPLSPFSPLLA